MADPCVYTGTICKALGETARVGIDFAELLATGETLTSPPVVTVTPAGPTVTGAAIDGTAAVCLVAGGTAGVTYKVVFTVTTDLAQTRVRYLSMTVEASP